MAIAGCKCRGQLANTGIPVGDEVFGKTALMLHVPLVATDGTRNSLDLTSSTLGDDVLAMMNNPDPSKRAYPLGDLNSVTHDQEDTQFETLSDGQKYFLRKGIRSISFESVGVSKQFYDKAADACVEFGTYKVDICGKVEGQKEGDNLYPRPVNKGSYDARYIEATDDSAAKVVISYDYKKTTDDNNQWLIGANELTLSGGGTLDAIELEGLIDVELTASNPLAGTNFTFDLDAKYLYGTAVNQIPFTGAAPSDFIFLDDSGASISPVGVTESTINEGSYAVELPSQGSGDVITVDVFRAAPSAAVPGFEGIETTITHP